MKIWQAHKTLADAVGDSCDISSNNIYDGVRYTKAERDSYLYQALISVFNKLIKPIQSAPRKVMLEMVNRYFPNMIRVGKITSIAHTEVYHDFVPEIGNLFSRPAIIIEMRLNQQSATSSGWTGLPIPFKTHGEVGALINSRNSQKADMFFTYMGGFPLGEATYRVYDLQQELSSIEVEPFDLSGELSILPYPMNPMTQLVTDDINMEEAYIDMVINTAIVLCLRDDQEIERIESIEPLISALRPQMGAK